MSNFVELTSNEMLCVDGGRSWDTAGEYVSGLGGGLIGGAAAGAIYGSAAGPAGAAVGAVVGFAGYWLMED